MRMIDLGLVSVLLSSSVACSSERLYEYMEFQESIESMMPSDFDYSSFIDQSAWLTISDKYSDDLMWYCSGFLVKEREVLTAAHCVDGIRSNGDITPRESLEVLVHFYGQDSIHGEISFVDNSRDYAYITLERSADFHVTPVSIGEFNSGGGDVFCYSALHDYIYSIQEGALTFDTVNVRVGPDMFQNYENQICGNGYFYPGSSGSSCFQNGTLVGVVSSYNESDEVSCASNLSDDYSPSTMTYTDWIVSRNIDQKKRKIESLLFE